MKKIYLLAFFVVVLIVISGGYFYFSPKIVSKPNLDPEGNCIFLIGDEPFSYQPLVRFDIPVTWNISFTDTTGSSRLQVSINPDTGKIIWEDKRKGTWQVTVTASNWAGRDSQTFTVKHIIKPFIKNNLPPTITAFRDFKGRLDISGSQPVKLSCTHADIQIEDPVNFRPRSSIYWEKPEAGKYTIQFTASNPAGKHTRVWNVTVKGIPVKITSEPLKTALAGTDYKYQVKAIGTPGFRWKLEDAPQGMSIDTEGTLVWPANVVPGEGNYNVSIRVSNIVDGKTFTDTQTFTIECKREEEKKEKKAERKKTKKQTKLTNVTVKRVFKEDTIIKKQKKIVKDQEKLLEKLPKKFKPEQKKAIDSQKEAIKKAEEARKRALELKKRKLEEQRLEAERKEMERQRVEAEKLEELLRKQEEAERQRILDAQKEEEQRKAEQQRLLKEQKERERQEALRRELEMKEKQAEAREKYLEAQRKAAEEARKKEEERQRRIEAQKKVARDAAEKARRLEAARIEAQRLKQADALRRQREAQKKALLLKQQEIELRNRQEKAKQKQEEARRKYLEEQQKLKEAAEKARIKQEKVAERIKRQKKLKREAEEARKIAERQRKIEEELRKKKKSKKVSVPTKRDMSKETVEKGKKIHLRYDFVMTGWSFTDFNRLARSREFKILFVSGFKAIRSENYEVTGLDNRGNPVVEKRRWDNSHYSSVGCIVADIPTEGKNLWGAYDAALRKKYRLGSYSLTLFFPYHFFTYLDEAAKSYYDAHKIRQETSFKQGAGTIKFTITKDFKFRILSMGNTR